MLKTRILLADDHAVVREGLQRLLEAQPDMKVVGEAADGKETLEEVRRLKPDVVTLDISMPRLNGLDVIWLIKEATPATQIIVFSMYGKQAHVQQAFAFGASGYALKSSPTAELLEGIRNVCQGKHYLSPSIDVDLTRDYVKEQREKPFPGFHGVLSDREEQIFRLIVQGRSTTEIAEILCISPKTVEKHREHISKKLGISTLVEMMQAAIKVGIINSDFLEV